jgi:hypothetical protein
MRERSVDASWTYWMTLLLSAAVAVAPGCAPPTLEDTNPGAEASLLGSPIATLQAASMTTKTVGAACGGSCWELWSNGYIESTVTFPSAGKYRFDISAYGTFAGGAWPNLELRIDQVKAAAVTVDSSSKKAFSVDATVAAGAHRVAVAFTNDYYVPPEDRNLVVYQIVISPILSSPASGALGCYADTATRDLPFVAQSSNTVTVESCVSACGTAGYKYAGVQYGHQCFCGNGYGTYGTSTNCSMLCAGNAAEICGGNWANSIYPASATPAPPPATSTCTPTSCAAQGKNCGSLSDGCGGTLQCGSCASPQTCGGSGVANVCGGGSTVSTGGLIDPSRKIDWSLAGVTGGIPSRTTICATLNPGATAAQINSAIAACPSGQVVKLNAGTYNLSSPGIDFGGHSNVTLRGAGPDQTFLTFAGGNGCMGLWTDVCVAHSTPNSSNPGTVADWTAGYAKGTTSLTLSTVSGLAAGDLLFLDQLDDTADTGNTFVCQAQGVCSREGGSGGRPNRAQVQIVKVTAISGTTVSFTPGLHMPNWRAARSPQAWWVDPIVGVGVEDLSMNHQGSGTNVMSGLFFGNAYDCWAKNIRSLNSNRNHVWFFETAHSTVRDSYFFGTINAASQSYGVETYLAADSLVENNIFQHVTSPMMIGNNTGTVFGYNYSIDDYYYTAAWFMGSNAIHDAGIDHILIEGADGNGVESDIFHGTSNFVTVFRNSFSGWETGKNNNTVPVQVMAFHRYYNVIGNVLGQAGYHNSYEDLTPSGTNGNTSIFTLGWSGQGGSTDNIVTTNDPLVAATMMRWGNYDTVNAAARFVASEVPSGLGQYANPVPSTTNLPPSLYLSAKPSWFGAVAWPPIGPDVSGGPGTGGHAYKIPARLCYEGGTKDVDGSLIFNANKCY